MRWAHALVVLMVVGAIAHAQPTPRNDGFIGDTPQRLDVDDCPALPPLSQDELLKLGGERYNRGEQLYLQGDYAGAVSELVLSYCTLPYYLLLKDIGQAYERELEYDKAIGYLQRYASQVPDNAQRPNTCAADPKIDKENVQKRVEVLRHLPGHVLVQADRTGPRGGLARVSIATETTSAAAGKAGEQLSVERGHYTMVVELDGYVPYKRTIDVEIGKPYTYFAKLDPLTGTASIQVTPADARIFIDDRFVGIGHFTAKLPAHTYTLSVEAQGLITQRRMISILPNKVERLQVELYPEPQTGRLQAISYATVGGGLSLAALAAFGDNSIATGISLVAGAAAGFVTSTYAMPRDIPLGTSSLAITTSVFGAVVGAATATLFTDKTERVAPFGGIGALAGGALGYITGLRTRVRPGEAAVINSALLWGTTAGGLFALSFNAPDARTSGGLVLGGLSMGAVGGLLVTRYFTISRVHAALVDVGGVIGAIGGVALEGILYPPKNGQTARDLDATTRGRIANFALGGMALGLITAGILTRDFDAPALALTPSIGHAIALDGRTMTTFGVAARW